MKYLIAILQVVCIALITWGILIEYNYEAHLGFIFITAGSLAFALSEKLDKFRIKRDLYKRNNQRKD